MLPKMATIVVAGFFMFGYLPAFWAIPERILQGPALAVRGELLLRVPPNAPPGPEHADADRSKGDPPPYQQAQALLERRGFSPQITRALRTCTVTSLTASPRAHGA